MMDKQRVNDWFSYVMLLHSKSLLCVNNERLNHVNSNELLALPFQMGFERSQNLTLVGQLTRIIHMWRIIIGCSN